LLTEQYRAQGFTSPREPMSEALEVLLEQKLLYQRAIIDSIGLDMLAVRAAEAAENSVATMITEAGGIKALETEKRKPLYAIKEEINGELKEYYGASEMYGYIQSQVKVTPGEVDRFYRRIDSDSLPIIPEQYVYAQITKLPKSAEVAKQRTKDKLLELRQRIIDGEKFDRLAMAYSVDGGSVMQGGEYPAGPKEQWHRPFGDALAKLQPGQISDVVETESGFHIIQLLDKPGDNLYHMRHILLKPTYTIEEQAES
jgi:peptidyl-prolyl cis-trans isomerase SurA